MILKSHALKSTHCNSHPAAYSTFLDKPPTHNMVQQATGFSHCQPTNRSVSYPTQLTIGYPH